MAPPFGRAENTFNAVWRFLLRLVIIGAVCFACYRLRNIITTVFIAAIIAYVLNPAVDWLCRQEGFVHTHDALALVSMRVKVAYRRVFLRQIATPEGRVRIERHLLRVYASLYVFVLAVVVLWQGTRLVVTPFVEEVRVATSPANVAEMREAIDQRLKDYDEDAPKWRNSSTIKEQLSKIDFALMAKNLAAEAGRKALEGAKNIVEIVVLPVLAFYFLIDGRKLKHEFVALVPRRHLRETVRVVNEFNRIMEAFVKGQVILCALAGVVVGTGLALLHVRYPFVLGVLAGVTRAIPIIGPIIGGIPIVLLTLVTKGPGTALAVLGFFTFLHFAESKFIMPLLIGDRMELHPFVVIIVLIAGGEIGGLMIGGTIGSLLGMFFAAPLASIARVMVRRYWLGLKHTAHPAIDGGQAPITLPTLTHKENYKEA